jgi:hypothetical protein
VTVGMRKRPMAGSPLWRDMKRHMWRCVKPATCACGQTERVAGALNASRQRLGALSPPRLAPLPDSRAGKDKTAT